ncbi:MAG: ParB/RepB/Spo0J family partition protein [Thermodesulfobacteriota bacterium]|nr:ParB/RepB/Spo0J family partition protein [Thermodesulfobacteriota bacterium]
MSKEKSGKSTATPRSPKKRALGRGLDALFPDIAPVENGESDYFLCEVDAIAPNRFQSRDRFSEDELAELAASIKQEGIIQPIVVRKANAGYELVAGERRLRAAKIAGLKRVPTVVRDITDQQHLVFSIIENVQRENLNPLEEADGYHTLVSKFEFSQEQVAETVGKSRSAVANFLRLRHLPEDIKDSIKEGRISMGHARALLGVRTPQQQTAVWQDVIKKDLSVRQTEALVKAAANAAKSAPPTPRKKARASEETYFSDLADKLSRNFGTKVQIKRKGKKGKVEIEFYSNEDLNRVLELLEKG